MNQTEKQNKELKKQLSPKKYSNVRIKSLFAFVLITLFSLCGETAKANVFSYTYQGTTLYYETTSSNTVQVSGFKSLGGAVVIPSQAYNDNGITYSVTSIGDGAFTNCSLTSITIPKSVTDIGKFAFQNCSSLTSITIPNSVTSIGRYAFFDCSSLTSITIPNSVTSIGDGAFSGCSSLTSITIPNSVTEIDNSTFWNCSSLTSITIGNSITYIASHVFYGCSSLTSITIPKSVTYISDSSVFYGCSSLAKIVVESGNTKYDSRNNCNAIIKKSTNSLMVGCKNTIIPNSVTGIDRCAFENCKDLKTIKIPNSVIYIDSLCFADCKNLTKIELSSSLGFIGNKAFKNCTSLDNIFSKNTTPPTIENDNVFENVASNVQLFVPKGSINTYKQANGWKKLFNIHERDFGGTGNVGIQDIDISSNISLYPNPADKEVYLTLNNLDWSNAKVVIYDIQGNMTESFEVAPNKNNITLDVSFLQKGVYTIVVSNDKTKVTQKLIKQ